MKAGVYVFAVIGVLMTVGVGYIYATNSELMGEFWSVKEDFRALPSDRRTEVVAELPARITFEKEVAAEMAELPEERRTALYEQLKKSRDQVYDSFKKRITAEAEVARKAKEAKTDVKDVAKEIEKQLGKVDVGIDLTGKSKKPSVDNLSDVKKADDAVTNARVAYGEARESKTTSKRVDAAINVLKALETLGNKVTAARKKSLTSEEKGRLTSIVQGAKATWYDVKQTPGLMEDSRYNTLNESVKKKLNE
jgi:hypothetical protein